ncbi:hypothetical protein DICVIV_13663 [Dictyocaulus viviparus]|uniref:Uncharacterized protein n=1 Tax=Dictyocaulus viviparus TaxID=29172 RepID=A0A0D8X9S7_DICVI|nr:hypothetical protein DICVIV_13663 [Dictyocaulus viviparus]
MAESVNKILTDDYQKRKLLQNEVSNALYAMGTSYDARKKQLQTDLQKALNEFFDIQDKARSVCSILISRFFFAFKIRMTHHLIYSI